MKTLTLEEEICAFMLAIVLERHAITTGNELEYYTAGELCSEANKLNSDKSLELTVDSSAVHQSFRIFRKSLLALNIDMLIISPREKTGKAMDSFHSLETFSNGWKIKFNLPITDPISEDFGSRINPKRDLIIKLSLNGPSNYNDLRILNYELLLKERETSFLSPTFVPRKKVSTLGKRYLDSLTSKIISEVSTNYSTDDVYSLALMNSIVDVAGRKSRKLDVISNLFGAGSNDIDGECNDNESTASSNSDESISDSEFSALCDVIPVKKIKYSTVEKTAIITLFDEVKGIMGLFDEVKKNAKAITQLRKE